MPGLLLPLEGCCCWRWGGAQASNKPSLCGAHLQIIGYLAREPLIVNCWIHNISTEKLIFTVITSRIYHLLSINTTLQMANMYIYIYYTVDIKLDIPWFRVDIYHGICFLMVFCKSKYIYKSTSNKYSCNHWSCNCCVPNFCHLPPLLDIKYWCTNANSCSDLNNYCKLHYIHFQQTFSLAKQAIVSLSVAPRHTFKEELVMLPVPTDNK